MTARSENFPIIPTPTPKALGAAPRLKSKNDSRPIHLPDRQPLRYTIVNSAVLIMIEMMLYKTININACSVFFPFFLALRLSFSPRLPLQSLHLRFAEERQELEVGKQGRDVVLTVFAS